jgi:hypothetical protein
MNKMFKEDGGFINVGDHEVDALKQQGWKIISPQDWNAMLNNKRKPVEVPAQPATIEGQPTPRRAGRPRKELPAFLGVTDGDSVSID